MSPVESSSSAPYVEKHLAWEYLNPAISYGEFSDERDGHVYKYMEYNGMRIMAENLNYSDSVQSPNLRGNSWCPHNDLDSCSKYGRLYTWAAAMNVDPSYNETLYHTGNDYTLMYQGLCPEGWSIYTNEHVWKHVAFGSLGDYRLCALKGWRLAGCTDSAGFSALPNGYRTEDGKYAGIDSVFTYWTLLDQDFADASRGTLGIWDERYFWNALKMSKLQGAGVRCMQWVPRDTTSTDESSSSGNAESSESVGANSSSAEEEIDR